MLVMISVNNCQECSGEELTCKQGTDGYWISCSCGKKGPYRSTPAEAITGWNEGQQDSFHLALQRSFRQAAGNFALWFLAYCEKNHHKKLGEIPELRRRCKEWMAS